MAALSPVPTFNDLKITYLQNSLVCPSKQTPKQLMFLSNIDQIVNYNVSTAHFFKPNPDFPPEDVSKRLKMALEKVLLHYDFMAGRLQLNEETGRLEVDCNGAGVGFVVAVSELSLDEIGSYLVYPNLGYKQLAVERLENLDPEVDQPLCFLQITSFKCVGFAIGMCMNHILLDGLGAKTLIENLASQAFDEKPLAVIPYTDRRLLAARSPPQVSFPHPEFLDLGLPIGPGSSPPSVDCKREELSQKIFKLSPNDISKLKETATTTRISTFAVVAALIWRCKALSNGCTNNKDRVSTLLNMIDVRSRRNPRMPLGYCGNATLPLGVSAPLNELENGPFSNLIELISERPNAMTDEYVKSAFDWMELRRGIPNGDYTVSSWLKLGFDQIEYPWGKPVYSCPIVNHRKEICWVFPDAIEGGIGAMVALPPQEMKSFDSIFQEFIGKLRC